MHQAGWRVTGVDCAADTVAQLRRSLGVPVLLGSLPHAELQERSFDVVTMWHSLEHVHHPLDTLRAARRLLAPGGRLVIAVPNIESTAYRWFGPAWFGLDLPRKLCHRQDSTLHGFLNGQVVPHSVRLFPASLYRFIRVLEEPISSTVDANVLLDRWDYR